eukprot:438222-Pelagomonas_calceolata.AAC.1
MSLTRIWSTSSAVPPSQMIYLAKVTQFKTLKPRPASLHSDWAALIISVSKTKVTGILQGHPPRDRNGETPSQTLQ